MGIHIACDTNPGNTYVIAVDEVHLGDTWLNIFTPSLQSVFNTPVVSAYTLTIGNYPNDNASGNGVFSTPAMYFVTDTSVVNQSSPTMNLSGGAYWTGLASAVDTWTIEGVLGSGSNPTSTLTIVHSGTTGYNSVSMNNLSVNSIVANNESVAAVASIGNLSSSGYLDVINTNNAFGNGPLQGTLSGLSPYGTSLLDVAGSAVGGGVTSPSTNTTTAVAVSIGLESIPNSNQGGTGGGDVHGTGFVALKVDNLIPSTNANSAFFFSGMQASVDNFGSGDTYEISASRGFANNLGTSTQAFLLGGDFEVIQSAASGLTTTLAGVFTLASTVNAGANTTTSMYAVYAQAAHHSAVTLPSEYGLYVITGGSTGTITNDYSVYIDSPVDASTMTNHYGIYMADQTVSSGGTNPNPFAIFTNGGKHYLKGNVLTSGILGWGTTSTPDTGISRLGAASLAIGNGTAGDFTGSIKLSGINITGTLTDGTGAVGTNGQVLSSTVTGTKWIAAASGTVSSFSSGNLSPLFTTSVATSTTTPSLSFSLSNAAGGTIFGNPTGSSGAPSYTSTPVLGINASTNGTLGLANGGASGVTITVQNLGATSAYNFNLPATPGSSGQVLVSQGGGSSSMTWGTNGATVSWDTITNAANNLSLSNAGYTSTFNQTSAVAWLWANTTVATNSTTNASPMLELAANYWTGAASAADTWTIGSSLAAGTNGISTLAIAHSGSTGSAQLSVPTLKLNGSTGSCTFGAVGNGTEIDTTVQTLHFTGGSINIATTTASTNININPTGSVTFQGNKFQIGTTGKVTEYNGTATVRNGMAAEYASSDLTAQSAAITATTLLSAPQTGMYKVSWSATITTASDISSVLGGTNGFQVIYTSPTDSVAKTTVPGNSVTSSANTTGTAVGGVEVIYAKTGTNIQFTYGYTDSHTSTAMAYELHISLESL